MLVVDQVLSTKHQECEFLERKKRNPLKCSRISYKDELVLVTPLWRCKSKIEPGCLAWQHTWSSGLQVRTSVVGTALGAFIPCYRHLSAADHPSPIPLAAEGGTFPWQGEVRILHGTGQELLNLFLEKPSLAELSWEHTPPRARRCPCPPAYQLWPCWNRGHFTLCKMSNFNFKPWLAEPSNCLGK